MGFEIQDGKEHLPDEEDIYGVNDIEEQDRFNALMGDIRFTQEERLRRRRMIFTVTGVVVLLAFVAMFYFLR